MHDVIISGGGPVGLFLGGLLRQSGVDVLVLEKRTQRSDHSRAIGIHPPSLAALEGVGAAAPLIAQGVQIHNGVARTQGRDLAGLSFSGGRTAYPFVLAVPQTVTESVLEQRLRAHGSDVMVRGAQVMRAHDDGTQVTVSARIRRSETDRHVGLDRSMGPDPGIGPGRGVEHAGDTYAEFSARLLVGADGARSALRSQLDVATYSRDYPDTYLMGDFRDNTGDGATAVLHLEPGGIVESFPLPGGVRRWVVHTDALCGQPTAGSLAELIRARTGAVVDPDTNSMLSAFTVRSRLARRLIRGRLALIGDAAHEISPIGGQGMNLGWLDAVALAPIITAALDGKPSASALHAFERSRQRAARQAVRQAHLNMALGRPLPRAVMAIRNRALAQLVAAPAVHNFVARRFTMQ
ncbi:FAD-dependent oxidoreductase [Arthrobacter sp. H14-L1]|uniref:FAD-dependent oxidoreductase n=1 Tax=Arthrobacter sp. H14-L1 TaxID=2996697 RepID=UPI00226F856B|nr:NAD(P)/FAD-dependent oxidoreductase [Arthrobacter sp. H14-L1]MCY0903878.1 NAD(P)/FAD-dependent oxidoreductase [Arthrobacter sp. H14-L1]